MRSFRSSLAFKGTLMVWGIIVLVAISSVAAAWEIESPFTGVIYNQMDSSASEPIVGWGTSIDFDVIEIDLGADGISFVTTPSNGATAGHTDPQTTMDFMQSSGSQIAINAAPFYIDSFDGGYYTVGRHYSEGNAVNTDAPVGVPSIDISSTNVPTLLTSEMTLPAYWNTISGSKNIVSGGTAIDDGSLDATSRTAIGYCPTTNKLIMATADYSGMSDGATSFQLGKLMAHFGADWAVELADGYSSQMAWNKGTAEYVNTPIDPYTTVATHLGAKATVDDTFHIFANFEHGNEGNFAYRPGYSGSTTGILDFVEGEGYLSFADPDDTQAGEGEGSMKLTITDDPNAAGEWFTRIISGRLASRDQNTILVADGYIGLMAMTETPDTYISIAVDDIVTGDRGVRQSLIADGEWHWYQWNLDDAEDWEAWVATSAGDGEITTPDFTIDSFQVWGTTDAVIYVDQIAHDSDGPLAPLVVSIPGDANNDGKVDGSDVTILANNWQAGVGAPDPETITWAMGDFNGDGQVDGSDVTILANNWQFGVTTAAASVPEPSMIALLFGVLATLAMIRRIKK